MFNTPDSAAALAATIQQATARAEPIVTRIDFAPGHEDERLTDSAVAGKLRLMKAAPQLLAAARDARREIRALSKACGEGLLTPASLKALDEAIAAATGSAE